jgi:hypothetical protein
MFAFLLLLVLALVYVPGRLFPTSRPRLCENINPSRKREGAFYRIQTLGGDRMKNIIDRANSDSGM